MLFRPSGNQPPPLTCLSLGPSGKRVACGTQDARVVLLSTKTGKPLRALKGHEGIVSSVEFVNHEKLIISCSWDGTTRLWNWGQDTEEPNVLKHSTQAKALSIDHSTAKGAAGSREGEVKVFSVKTMKCIRNIPAHKSDIAGLGFTEDDEILVTASWDGECALWDTHQYEKIRTLTKQKQRIRSLVLAPDDSSVFLGLHNGTILKASLEDKTVTEMNGHHDIVTAMKVSPNGEQLLSGSWDRSIRVWNIDNGRETELVKLWTGVTGISWDLPGESFYSSHMSGALVHWVSMS